MDSPNRKSILFIAIDVIALITATFGTYIFKNKIPTLILGIATCIILIALLSKAFKLGGAIIGILISVFLMSMMINQVMNTPTEKFSDKISENTKVGDMEISIEELVVGYRDNNGTQQITSDISVTSELCDDIVFNSIDYDVVLDKYEVKEGKIVFYNIPAGTYDIKIQLKGFSQYSGTLKLKESELLSGVWYKTICLQSENEYKDFQIVISDGDDNILKGYKCDFNILDTNYDIKDIVSDSEGKLPYTFSVPIDLDFQMVLHYDNETYLREFSVDEIGNPLYIQFYTPKKEKIEVSEVHTPNDAATIVSLPDWNVDEDIGIDGKKYGGGLKVKISDMFIEMGSNGDKDVTSRITLPIDGNSDDTTFSGVFVLDQSMYGSNSSGNISIIINNEEVFTTGKIDGNTVEPFHFNVNFKGADSIIILTEAHLEGSAFEYGFVSEK